LNFSLVSWHGGGVKPPSIKSSLSLIALCYLGMALVSIARFALAGTLKVDDILLPWVQWLPLQLLFGIFAGLAGWIYLKSLSKTFEKSALSQLLVAAIGIHLIAALALPFTSNDLFSNLAYGRMSQLGIIPYLSGPEVLDSKNPFASLVGSAWQSTPMVYGPILGVLNSWIVKAGDVWQSLIAYKLVLLVFSIGIVFLAYVYCRSHLSRDRAVTSFIFIALNPVLLWEVSGQAHNDGVMVFAMMGFIILASLDYPWAAIACLTFAFFAKFAVLPLLGLYLCYIFYRSPLRAILMGFGIAAVGLFLNHDWLQGFLTATKVTPLRITNSFTYLIYRAFTPAGEEVQQFVYKLCNSLSTLFLIGLALRFALRAKTLQNVLRDSLLFLLLYNLIFAAGFQPWYVTWLLPMALAVEDKGLQQFVAIYSVVAIIQYTFTNCFLWSALNIFLLTISSLSLGRGIKGEGSVYSSALSPHPGPLPQGEGEKNASVCV
jgi:hypothetical protein